MAQIIATVCFIIAATLVASVPFFFILDRISVGNRCFMGEHAIKDGVCTHCKIPLDDLLTKGTQ
jgi:hypothetical protein